jgi:hypothetical protein
LWDDDANGREARTMRDQLDAGVHDGVALDEIELYGEMIIAASSSERPLTSDEIDKVLGVARAGREGERTTGAGGRSER